MQNENKACCHGPGIVCGVKQQFHDLYPAGTALRRGTIFPELDKPSAVSPIPCGGAEPSQHQETAFAAYEMRLYLNTHPEDRSAEQLYRQLWQRSGCHLQTWRMDDPWPWELCANEGRD